MGVVSLECCRSILLYLSAVFHDKSKMTNMKKTAGKSATLCGSYRLNVAVLFNKQAFVALQIVRLEFESHCLGKCEIKTPFKAFNVYFSLTLVLCNSAQKRVI